MEQIKQIAKVLESLSFPARPTKKQLLLYKEVVYKTRSLHKKPHVLILGATPELRDLCIAQKCKVTAISPGNTALAVMTYLMKYKDHPNNKAIEGNWTNMPLPDNSCELALTDIALTGNPCQKYEPILKEVHRILKPGGFFFLRTFDMLEHETKPDPDKLILQWRAGQITTGDFFYLSARLALDKDHNIEQIKNLKLFVQYCQEGKFTEQEIKQIRPYISDGTMSCPYRKDLIKTFSKFFDNISIKCARDRKNKTVEQNALFFMTVKK